MARFKNNGRSNFGNSSGNRFNRQEEHIKKSGATYTKIKTGKNEGLFSVNAWRKTKNGLMVASAFPAGGEEYTSQAGNVSRKYAIEVVNRDMGTTQTYWALMDLKSRKIFIKELGLVISPNGRGFTAGGKRVEGYFGKI